MEVYNKFLKLIENKIEDIDKVLSVLNWTHNQWRHNGSNEPSKNDALTILKEARGGKKFRCVEYGIVASTALQSLNFKARVLGLKTADVETKKYGAGHVLAEVWMPQFNKWVLIDGQFNLMPILENVPLNAVEFQQAISENKNYNFNSFIWLPAIFGSSRSGNISNRKCSRKTYNLENSSTST